jgi:hypothetical protein
MKLRCLFPRSSEEATSMTSDEMKAAVQASLMISDSKSERRNVYRFRPRGLSDAEIEARLRPSGNVVPIRSRPPEPPAAA